MIHRTTPEVITNLQPNEIFVFGSNLAGRHGAGAAKQALQFGAKIGIAYGLEGQTFAIPTKDKEIKILDIRLIACNIDSFIYDCRRYYNKFFLVTKIGCGLAGYTPADIAPLFKKAIELPHIHLPSEFWEVLNKAK